MSASSQILDLRSALDHGEIVPYFQPVVDLKTRQVLAFEVLARRLHPRQGILLPFEMIRLAESSGLIGRITEAMMEQTAELARSLPGHLRFAINISPAQFCAPSFPDVFCHLKEKVGLKASQLILEITESALLDDFDLALANSLRLKSFGVQLALDDFGTGYSSLRHLQALPFDEIKVDGSFVKSMSSSRASRKIVAAIIGLSHSLGLTTVAEGIEAEEHAAMLFYLGCSRGQGWLFSPALPAAEVPGYLAALQLVEPGQPSPPSGAAVTIGTTLEVLPAQRLSQLQAIYDGAQVGLCFLDRELRYISLNKPFAAAHGISAESHLGRLVPEVIPAFYPEVASYLERALAGERVSDIEVSRPDFARPGHQRTYLVTYQPATDEVGEVVGISVVAVDITERKRAENALRASIDHYWRAGGVSPQMPWTAAPDGAMLDISPRWEIMTGLTYEEVIEGRWVEAVYPEDRDRVIAWWARSISTATPLDILFRIVRKDGELLWIRSSAAPRVGQDGKVIRWYGTLEEIDARRAPEQPAQGE